MLIYSDSLILIFSIVFAAVIGAVFGSFLNCTAWRIAHGESIVKGRSHCPSCGHELGVLDLFPVFSWIFLGARCRYCKAKIPVRYLLAELFMVAMTVLCVLKFDISWLCLRNFIVLCCLFCLSLVDLEIKKIPNVFIIIMIVCWGAFLPLEQEPLQRLLWGAVGGVVFGGGVLLISLLMDKILGKESLGGGDVKLLFVMGLYLELLGGVIALIMACILGLIFVFITQRGKKQAFPFGPAISLAFWIMLLYGNVITDWYAGFFR